MILDLEIIVSSFFILWQFFFEEQKLWIGQIDQQSQGDIEQLPVVAVLSQDGQQVTLDNLEITQSSSDLMIGVISPQEPDQVLDTLHTVWIWVVGSSVTGSKVGTCRLKTKIELGTICK